jgi:Flp pilus assembly protein TadD
MKLQPRMMIAGMVVLAAAMAAGPVFAQGTTVFVELSRPQCDDQGHYMPYVQDGIASVIGFAAARGGVTSVTVNDIPAELFDADYRPFNTPAGYGSVGFRLVLQLYPDTPIVVNASGAAGDAAQAVYRPDEYATFARLQGQYGQYGQDPYWNLRLANAYCDRGDCDAAYPYYHRCEGLRPDFYLASFFLGLSLFDEDRDDDAIWQFRHCAQLRPSFYLAHYDMGRCYDRRGRYDDAVNEFRIVINVRPQFVEAHWRLGETYSRRGDWDGAGTEYRTALRYNPNFAPAHHGLGAVLARKQDWNGATSELQTATRLSPGNAQARSDLAATLAHREDWVGATKQYRQAARIAPQNGGAHQGLAQSQYATGKYGQAWDSVHSAQRAGMQPDPAFVKQLRSKMPEPAPRPVAVAPYVPPVNPRNLPNRPQTYRPPTQPAPKPAVKAPTGNGGRPQAGKGHEDKPKPVAPEPKKGHKSRD